MLETRGEQALPCLAMNNHKCFMGKEQTPENQRLFGGDRGSCLAVIPHDNKLGIQISSQIFPGYEIWILHEQEQSNR